MKVLQVMAGAAQGGAETFFVQLVSALQRRGVDQHAVIRTHAKRAATLRAAGVEVTEVPFRGALDVASGMRVRGIAKRFAPKVAIAWMGRAASVLPHGAHVNVGRLGGWYDLKRFRSCDHLVANTRAIRDWCIEQKWPAERVHFIPNFVNWHVAVPQPRAALQTPDDATVLLALGRLHRNKAFDVAIRALADVPGTYLWLAGEGELRTDLEKIAEEAGVTDRVRFLGWRDDKESLFAAADICLVPSRDEPFGNVVLDAWASGTPLVVADAEGPREFVRDGADALMVPKDDAAALAAAINRLIASPDLRRTLAEGGKARWQADFTEAACVAAWKDFFAKVTA